MLDDDAACDDDAREHLSIIACLPKIIDEAEERMRCGGSRSGRKKSKPQLRLEGHTMLYKDYFSSLQHMPTIFDDAIG
jgi:hypothetical protein